MSAGAPAIPAPGPFPGSHAPPIGQLRVARRPGRPPSGPLRAFQPQRHTPTTPLKPLSNPQRRQRRFQAPLPLRAPQRHLQHRSNAGAPSMTWRATHLTAVG